MPGDYVCSGHTCLITIALYHGIQCSYTTWTTSLSHNLVSIAFLKLQSRFLSRGMIPLSIYDEVKVDNYHSFGVYVSQIDVQHIMLGFLMEGCIIMTSIICTCTK